MRDDSKGRQIKGFQLKGVRIHSSETKSESALDLELTHVAFLRTRAFFWFLCFPKIPTSYFPQRPFFFFADQGLTQASCGVSTVRRACHTAELHLIDPVSMGRPPRRQGSARRPLRPGRYGRHEIQDLGHLGGPENEDFGGLDGAEDEPKRREAGALGAGQGGGFDGGDGSKEMRRGLS